MCSGSKVVRESICRNQCDYSVVTDLARLRGKSTSTPFMTAKSDISVRIIKSNKAAYGRKGAVEE